MFLAGCGGAERVAAVATPTPDDRAAIQARVATYMGFLLAREGEKACAQLTPEYRRDMDRRAAGAGLGDCSTVLTGFGEIAAADRSGAYLREAAKPNRVIVLLQGDRAQASVKLPDGRLSASRTALRRVGSRWLIERLGVSRTG